MAAVKPAATSAPAAAEAAERLRALGYVSGPTTPAASNPRAPNPSLVIDSWAEFETALAQLNAGRRQTRFRRSRPLPASFPKAPVFLTTYGRALKDAGRPAEAVTVYKEAVTRIRDANLFHDLAIAARAAGNIAEATNAERAAIALEGKNPAALNGLGLLQAEAGHAGRLWRSSNRPPRSIRRMRRTGPTSETRAASCQILTQAESAYRRALEVDPDFADAANGLGTVLVQIGQAGRRRPVVRTRTSSRCLTSTRRGSTSELLSRRAASASARPPFIARFSPPRRPAFSRERAAAADLLRQIAK